MIFFLCGLGGTGFQNTNKDAAHHPSHDHKQ
jgi:hypothetical protein